MKGRTKLSFHFKNLLVNLLFLIVGLNTYGQSIKILFDASKAESAGNADWVIDADARNLGFGTGPAILNGGTESNAQRIPFPAQSGITNSTAETYWSGALSNWGIDCVNRNYIVESLPYNGQITYGNSNNSQDLSNYDVYIVCEPNILFTAAEKTAILNFVQNGGGLLMVSDHDISDRNNDGYDSPHIWNDLMTNNSIMSNPFGMLFDYVDFSQTTSNIPNLPSDSIINGVAGSVSQVQFSGGTTMTLSPSINASVKGVVYTTGSAFGNNNVMCAYSRFGNGKVAAIGDSSPCDDGTGDPNDVLFYGYTQDANGNHRKLLMNMTIWLATKSSTTLPTADFTASPLTICTNQSSTFTNISSSNSNSYSWNFGSGASPSTANTVGPHSVTYSSSGLKTISLTVTNSAGSNTMTKTNYLTVNGNCSTNDVGVIALLNPVSNPCPSTNSPIKVTIKNFSTTSINFSTYPVTVTLSIQSPSSVVQTFSKVINSGSLNSNSTLDVTFSGTYDLSASGNYLVNSNTTLSSDVNTGNDALPLSTVTIGNGYASDVIIFSENMGNVSTTTAITTHETNNGFQNVNLTMSGTADVRSTTPSSSYTTASAGANIFFTTSSRTFIIAGINTQTSSNLELSFGILKSLGTSTGSEMSLQYSIDGTNFINLTIPNLPSGTGWNYVTATGIIPASSNLVLRFTNNSSTVQFRIDDVLLVDHVTQPNISLSGSANFCSNNGPLILTASIAASYFWSTGSTSQSISVNSTGTYSVTVTNSSGCTASSSPVSVNVYPTYSTTLNRFIAQGTNYTLPNGSVVSVAGTYTSSFQSVANCDSSIITILSLVNVNDNSLCTNDFCDLYTGAISHIPVNVDDNNPCTIDGCDPLTGVYHNLQAEICGNGIDDNCNGLIDEGCNVSLNLNLMLEGFSVGGGLLRATVNPATYPTLCDSILLELHSAVSPYNLLFFDKKTIDVNGNCVFSFPYSTVGQSYYLVVKHRNSLETWSNSPLSFSSTSVTYSFKDAQTKAFGNNLKDMGNGTFALISGDVDQNGEININDMNLIEDKSKQFFVGYTQFDLSGNSLVESTDYSLVENNLGKSVLKP